MTWPLTELKDEDCLSACVPCREYDTPGSAGRIKGALGALSFAKLVFILSHISESCYE